MKSTDDQQKATVSGNKSAHITETQTETFIIIPPDGGWGWLVVFGAFVSYYIADGLQYSFGIFLKDIAGTFQCPTSQVSLAGAICTCIFCVTGPFSAAMVNRYSYRVISIVGAILASISCFLTSLSTNIYLVIFFHGCIGGVGFGMIYITALIAVGFYFERWRGLATGIAVCGAGLGAISLPPVLMVLINNIGWRHTFQCLGGFCLLIIACGCLFRPLKPTRIILAHPRPSRSEQSMKSGRTSPLSFFEKYQNKNFNTLMDQWSVYKNSSEQIFSTMYSTGTGTSTYSAKTDGFDMSNRSLSLHSSKWRKCCCWCCRCRCKKTPHFRPLGHARPVYRDDIFFTGSLATVPEYRSSQINSKSHLEYQLSITRMPTHSSQAQIARKKPCCPNSIKRTLATMLDFRLMKSFKFLMLVFNAIFVSLGIYIPFMFIKDAAVSHGISEDFGSWLISTIGITNTLGRIICGVLSTTQRINSTAICYVLLFIAGVVTAVSTISYMLWVQFLYCAIFGLSLSSISALRTLIIVKMVGLENLTNAIGILLLFQGIASLAGLAIAGHLWDVTNDYKYSFYFGGVCLSTASVFLLILHVREHKDERRQRIANAK